MSTQKPDDAPVTFGELRRAMKLAVDYASEMTLYTTGGLAEAMSGKKDPPEGTDASKRLLELAAKIEQEFHLDELSDDDSR